MSEDDFLYFVEMPRRPVSVMEFAGLISVALHGDGDGDLALIQRGVVIMDVEEKARAGLLTVRSASTLSEEPFVQGEALWRLVVTPGDARPYLAARQIGLRITDDAQGEQQAVATAGAKPPAEWKDKARERAMEIIAEHKKMDTYPSQEAIADQIAREFRISKPMIVGADGKPLSGATIKRHALAGSGISSDVRSPKHIQANRGK